MQAHSALEAESARDPNKQTGSFKAYWYGSSPEVIQPQRLEDETVYEVTPGECSRGTFLCSARDVLCSMKLEK